MEINYKMFDFFKAQSNFANKQVLPGLATARKILYVRWQVVWDSN